MEKKRILIIDDEPGFTRMVRLNLEKTGFFEVREGNKATYAVAAAREFKPDLILLYVIMPSMDGGDIAAHIKADRHLRDVPVVFVTATVYQREACDGWLNSGGAAANWRPNRCRANSEQGRKACRKTVHRLTG